MNVAICVPWRPTPSRLPLFDYITRWVERELGWPVITGDTDDVVFNRSAARNAAVRASDADVVVILDADTVGQPQAFRRAVEATYADGVTRLPYTRCFVLDEHDTARALAGHPLPPRYEVRGACGGALVLRRDVYDSLGGHDERYTGWGYEDVDFAKRAKPERVQGCIWALRHERDVQGELSERNLNLLVATYGDDL